MGTMEVKDVKILMGDIPVEGGQTCGHILDIHGPYDRITFLGIYDPSEWPDWRAFERAVFAAISKAALSAYERWRKHVVALHRAGGKLLRKKLLQKKARKAMEEYWGMK